ncbi:MAG: hypothetical protein J0I20_33735 [Chloroflexi bacterium]|nr:hypothetical protein [Chloroflexota bacterium]OJW05575.1 MAG: hypothetical protein BGO39_02870 [Chloroflexi bacterium 54-19]
MNNQIKIAFQLPSGQGRITHFNALEFDTPQGAKYLARLVAHYFEDELAHFLLEELMKKNGQPVPDRCRNCGTMLYPEYSTAEQPVGLCKTCATAKTKTLNPQEPANDRS